MKQTNRTTDENRKEAMSLLSNQDSYIALFPMGDECCNIVTINGLTNQEMVNLTTNVIELGKRLFDMVEDEHPLMALQVLSNLGMETEDETD